ncbi:hypothetical protein IF1G_01654 [Cordyceps javanica]|uniref:Uncharacterized protein n=1 Tax=Cordyceps javanica TaxID=43265 RepID=A0A545VCU9_9HYPO|nr:hypothetical protein IF1G_01654 [Cordyceps javanica]
MDGRNTDFSRLSLFKSMFVVHHATGLTVALDVSRWAITSLLAAFFVSAAKHAVGNLSNDVHF